MRALRGQDKLSLSLYSFLGRAGGYGSVEDAVLQSFCYKAMPQWRCLFMEKIVAAYMINARRFLLTTCHEQAEDIVGDVVAFDCSRVASKELMLTTMIVAGTLLAIPLQSIPDQAELSSTASAAKKLTDTLIHKKKCRKTDSEGKSTRLCFIALVHAMLHVWPFLSIAAWFASAVDRCEHGFERHRDSRTGFFYRVHRDTGVARWCLAAELRKLLYNVRILVLAADEGSTGFAVFNLLASFGARVLFHRDPCHKLSNVFIDTVKGVPRIMQVVLDLLVVFKFRRAPYGGGRFWRETIQTISLLDKEVGAQHILIEQLRDEICSDIGLPVAAAESNPQLLRQHFNKVSKLPIGWHRHRKVSGERRPADPSKHYIASEFIEIAFARTPLR